LNALGHKATARPGERGQFDVIAGRELVFSKQEIGRFPEDGEIAALFSARS